ncbi:MAG: adenylate/guanylate cyclase domain-containing protein [Deltaproteobacteria bacterium]
MRSVRGKFITLVIICLVPAAISTRVFSFASNLALTNDILGEMKSAGQAFSLELQDDIATLRVAAQLISTDPDLARELEAKDQKALFEHIDDFASVYPGMRVFLTDADGRIVVTSRGLEDPRISSGLREVKQAISGRPFSGVARLGFQLNDRTEVEDGYSYALADAIHRNGKLVGGLLATFRLDRDYLDNTEQKEGLALALNVGGVVVASNADHPVPGEQLPVGTSLVRRTPAGRMLALASFVPVGLGSIPAPITVVAARDVSEQFATNNRYIGYRLAVLGAIALVALMAAFLVANPMVEGIRRIVQALPGVAARRYVPVEPVRTKDEIQQLAEAYNSMIGDLTQAARYREALGKYLSRAAREAVEEGKLSLGGKTIEATVLFSDIRGFTSLSERMPPEEVLTLLNRYFTEMVGAVVRHHGIVDKFIGDCIMVVWGPPTPRASDPLDAIRAALEMRERLGKLNVEFEKHGLPQLRTGIGIHTGRVVAGNIGAETTPEAEGKMEYTVIGDTVNLASRLESLTKELSVEVLISEETYRRVASAVVAEPMQRLRVRGREQELEIYRLVGLREDRVAGAA